jgi:hypothetical protein
MDKDYKPKHDCLRMMMEGKLGELVSYKLLLSLASTLLFLKPEI